MALFTKECRLTIAVCIEIISLPLLHSLVQFKSVNDRFSCIS